MGDTGRVSTPASTDPTAGAASADPTPLGEARAAWPWLLLQGVGLFALAAVAVAWGDGGSRVLLAGLGLVGVVRGVSALRGARVGQVDRQAAVLGASAIWLGMLAGGLSLLGAAVAGWAFVVLVVGILAAVLVRVGAGRRVAVAVPVAAAVVALAVGAALRGAGWLPAVATVAVAAAVAVLGIGTVVAAVATFRVSRRPVPVAPAGCAGCACGAGGCGGLSRG